MFLAILMDNNSSDPLLDTEHGFSAIVEKGGGKLLFDTGAGRGFLRNADKTGVRIDPDAPLILSHAHHDHTGGVPHLVRTGWQGRLYTGPGFFVEKGKVVDGRFTGIGPDFGQELLRDSGMEHTVVDAPLELLPGMLLFGGPEAAGNGYFFIKRDGNLVDDPFSEELHLLIRGESASVLVTGCAHCGILNIVEAANRLAPGSPVREIYGGLHLSRLPDEEVRLIGERILASGIRKAGLCHCSGSRLFDLLPEGPFFPISAGSVVELLS